MNDIDLVVEEQDLGLEEMPEGAALSSFSTVGSFGSASCPATSAGSASTVGCLG